MQMASMGERGVARVITAKVPLQDEFIDYHNALLPDLPRLNETLMDWLLFSNTKRGHHAFKNTLSQVQYLL